MQQTAIRERKPGNRARGFRENFCKRAGRQDGLPSAKQASGTAAGRSPGFSPVSVSLSKKSILEVYSKQHSDELLGNEALQMEFIEFLYQILSPASSFADTNHFTATSTCWQVLTFLIESLEKIIGERWDLIKDNGKLRIEGVKLYEQQSNRFYAIPLSFLPKLKTVSALLHDLIIDMAGLLHKSKGILLWEEDEAYTIDYFRDELKYNRSEIDKEYATEMRREVKLYLRGEASKYAKLITKQRSTKEQLSKKVSQFLPQNEREEKICDWLKSGLLLLEEPHRIEDFIHPSYFQSDEQDCPLLPTRYMRFVWQSDGMVMDNVLECLNSDCNEWGDVPLSWEIKIEKAGDLIEHYPPFARGLIEFLEKGVEVAEAVESSFR